MSASDKRRSPQPVEAAHSSPTPGPWQVAGDDKNGQAIVRSEHIEIATCWHHCVGSIEKEMRANARLIAAAPELLSALEKCVKELETVLPVAGRVHDEVMALIDADAAIRKAKGEA